jgi:hypothetical protein
LALQSVKNATAARAGAFYVSGTSQGVTSVSNTFFSCTQCLQGSGYYIISSNFTDSGSTYTQMQALYGGVLMCSSCNLKISDSSMDGSYSLSGGALMVENAGAGTITRTSFVGTSALYYGGYEHELSRALHA